MFNAIGSPILHRHKHCLQTERREIPYDPRHLDVPMGASKMISEPMLCLTQIVHLYCIKNSTMSKWIELSLEPRHLGVPLGTYKTISEPMICLVQTVHLSCIDPNTVSKQKEKRFHMTDITEGFHWVCPKWFLNLWYVRCKWRTYLASRLVLSPNEPSFHLSLV
jgi:hypothetical protein